MYYDRSIHDRLAETIGPGEPLSWLMDHVRSAQGSARHAHVQFRRDRGTRRRGGIQLYWGRTSPLEFRLRADGRVKLHADATYRGLSERLFDEPVAIPRLRSRQADFRAHLERASRLLDESPRRRQAFVRGEAVCHAGLMRRYGHRWRPADPLVAIDSEARIGYDGRTRRDTDNAETRAELRLDDAEPIPTKLDTVAVLSSGDVALVEVKGAGGSIERALVQAAAHLVRYSRLMSRSPLSDAIRRMIDQKTATGVIPPGCPRPPQNLRIVPCIAAPGAPNDWPTPWDRAFDQSGPELRAALADLLFIRLDANGSIIELLPPSARAQRSP